MDAANEAVVAAPAPSELARLARANAYALGFDLVGIAELGAMSTAAAYDAWVADGRAGTMQYLERGAETRRDSRLPLPGTTHAIVVAMDYGGREPSGPVARYARGDDYHEVMERRLRELHRRVERDAGRAVLGKPYVDTGPLLERDLARRAGLGWFGKNTMLVNPERGSFFFLGALVLDLELETDAPFEADRCGTCTRCLDACPTGAITAPRQLDARRCISYLTIELREGIPEELREGIGDRVYGCDVCQDVCPWNVRFARYLPYGSPLAQRDALAGKDARTLARELLAMSPEEFSAAFKNSPMKRAKLRGLKRNAAVVLGNVGTVDDVEVLRHAFNDPEPLVREHAAWALNRLRPRAAAE
ncbi:MAG TPA: tRNA epoxyqueuosine(34) reductase QueG [Gemmatimonadaceae bacterium]|nr:tRNA epoxyqueuosine(34) reductase QueG [Gemmatimonadaceae bacterium]